MRIGVLAYRRSIKFTYFILLNYCNDFKLMHLKKKFFFIQTSDVIFFCCNSWLYYTCYLKLLMLLLLSIKFWSSPQIHVSEYERVHCIVYNVHCAFSHSKYKFGLLNFTNCCTRTTNCHVQRYNTLSLNMHTLHHRI